MRALLPLLLLAAAPAAPPPAPATSPPDAGRIALAADAEDRWVPFELTSGNQIRFRMLVDGRPATAILDTGVSFSVVGRGSPLADPARVRARGRASAVGGAVSVGWMPTGSLVVGGLTRTGGGVGVAALPAAATGGAVAVDLLVGRDLVGGAALDIDYAGRRFRLLPSGRLPFAGAAAPLRVSPERQVYESEMTLGGRRFSPMMVDTGDGAAVTVTAAGWRAAGMAARPTTTALAYGLAGPVVSELAIVPALTLGALGAHDVEVRIEPAGGLSQAIGAAGRIGTGFLGRYRVLLDPGAGRMVLAPGALAEAPTPRSTSGLLVAAGAGRLTVVHVMRGGPAAAAGWREGETICAIDGAAVPADYAGSRLANWSVAPAGTVTILGMCDGDLRRLVARAFY